MKTLQAAVDSFLCPRIFQQSPERQFRARIGVFAIFFAALDMGFDVAFLAFHAAGAVALFWSSAILLLCFACLAAMRWHPAYERTIGLFLLLLMLMMSIRDMIIAPAALHGTIFAYPIFILMAFLICDRRWACIVTGWSFIQAILVFLYCRMQYPFSYVHFLSFEEAMQRRYVHLFIAHTMVYACMLGLDISNRWRSQQLHKEKDWYIRSSKLQELSSLVHIASLQMAKPLLILKDYLPDLLRRPHADLKRLGVVEGHLESLMRVSRSLSWLHQSHRTGSISESAMDIYLDQLRILLSNRAEQSGWQLLLEAQPEHMNLKGPLVSLTLLLICLGQRVIDAYNASSDNCLQIRLVAEEGYISWIVSWPTDAESIIAKDGSLEELEQSIRDAMINALTRECCAVLQENKILGQYYLTLTRPMWSLSLPPSDSSKALVMGSTDF
jgi:hypothetical protein